MQGGTKPALQFKLSKDFSGSAFGQTEGQTVNVLRLSGSILGVLLSAGWLCADTLIPGDGSIQFTKGGSHTTTITGFGLTSLTGDPPIGRNGGGTFGVINGTNETVDHLVFDIPTTNFNQPFFADTNLFKTATIQLEPELDLVVVSFFGIGFGVEGGFAFVPAPSCDDCETFVSPKFKSFSIGPPPPPAPERFFGGLLPGAANEATLILAPDPNSPGSGFETGGVPSAQFVQSVPEPGTFALLLSGAVLILGRRKLFRP